jgi:hypothetical protein
MFAVANHGLAQGSAAAVAKDIKDTSAVVPRWDSTGWRGRVVIGEYLTGIFCSACQPHEQAFDRLLQRYPTTVFIPLAYHGVFNVPIANAPDSLWERMHVWYNTSSIPLYIPPTPGHPSPAGILPAQPAWDDWINGYSGDDEHGVESADAFYTTMVRAIDSALQTPPAARLQVEVTAHAGQLLTRVTVDSLGPAHRDVYVRLVLLEDTVRLIFDTSAHAVHRTKTEHYMVVRSAARTAALPLGLPLQTPHGHGRVTYTFDVARLQRELLANKQLGMGLIPASQLTPDRAEEIEEMKRIFALFPDGRNWTLDPARLHVVAFVQDPRTGEILQAQMVPVHGLNIR